MRNVRLCTASALLFPISACATSDAEKRPQDPPDAWILNFAFEIEGSGAPGSLRVLVDGCTHSEEQWAAAAVEVCTQVGLGERWEVEFFVAADDWKPPILLEGEPLEASVSQLREAEAGSGCCRVSVVDLGLGYRATEVRTGNSAE